MKALTFDRSTDAFVYKELPIPTAGEGEVLIKVHACGLNPVDAKIAMWKSMITDNTSDWVPGLDVSGEIVALGEGVEQFKVGDKVLGHGNMLQPHGGFAEYSVQRAATLIPHPNLSAVDAAATPCAGWTAWRALVDKLQLKTQDSLLIAGGAGGVGSYAIQIANYLGTRQIIATASERNEAYVTDLGATNFINYNTANVVEEVQALTGGLGVSKGLDAVGDDNDILVANALGYEGEMVELVRTVRPSEYDDAFLKGLSFHQLSLGSAHRSGARAEQDLVNAGKALSALVESGEIRPPKIKVIRLDDVAQALSLMLQQRTVGKVVMAI